MKDLAGRVEFDISGIFNKAQAARDETLRKEVGEYIQAEIHRVIEVGKEVVNSTAQGDKEAFQIAIEALGEELERLTDSEWINPLENGNGAERKQVRKGRK